MARSSHKAGNAKGRHMEIGSNIREERERALPGWLSTIVKVCAGAAVAILLMTVISGIMALTMFH